MGVLEFLYNCCFTFTLFIIFYIPVLYALYVYKCCYLTDNLELDQVLLNWTTFFNFTINGC